MEIDDIQFLLNAVLEKMTPEELIIHKLMYANQREWFDYLINEAKNYLNNER